MLLKHRSVWGSPRQSWILDSRLRIANSLSVENGFQNPIFTVIPDSLRCISDSKALDSGFHNQKRKNKFRNADWSLTCGEKHQNWHHFFGLCLLPTCGFFSLRPSWYSIDHFRYIKIYTCLRGLGEYNKRYVLFITEPRKMISIPPSLAAN